MPKQIDLLNSEELGNLLYQYKLRTGTDVLNNNMALIRKLVSNTNSIIDLLSNLFLFLGFLNGRYYFRNYNHFPRFFLAKRETYTLAIEDMLSGSYITTDGNDGVLQIGDVVIVLPMNDLSKITFFKYNGGDINNLSNWTAISGVKGRSSYKINRVNSQTTSSINLKSDDDIVIINASYASVTVYLENPSLIPGKEFIIIKEDDTSNVVQIEPRNELRGTVYIGYGSNRRSSFVLSLSSESVTLISDGGNNYILKYN